MHTGYKWTGVDKKTGEPIPKSEEYQRRIYELQRFISEEVNGPIGTIRNTSAQGLRDPAVAPQAALGWGMLERKL
jgi:hypothetical protein